MKYLKRFEERNNNYHLDLQDLISILNRTGIVKYNNLQVDNDKKLIIFNNGQYNLWIRKNSIIGYYSGLTNTFLIMTYKNSLADFDIQDKRTMDFISVLINKFIDDYHNDRIKDAEYGEVNLPRPVPSIEEENILKNIKPEIKQKVKDIWNSINNETTNESNVHNNNNHICLTCGTKQQDNNGLCINGHDDWLEEYDYEPELEYDSKDIRIRARKKFNMTDEEILNMLKENVPFDSYPGPPVVNTASNFLAAGASDGSIGGSGDMYGQTGAMGGEFPKKYVPSNPEPNRFKQTVKNVIRKESRKRKNALQKLQKLDKLLKFDEFQK